ncbi:hypothetical protein [Tautonia marina]|uniref:hypothetical protein n=1 Tax=Tautonia marina TaxID=2653855 RepID=UPI001260CB6B|nr:hypothetical protein [Tautonia marina]
MVVRRFLPIASAILVLASASGLAVADEPSKLDAPAAFERLKSLVGTWEQREGENVFVITYRLTANDSAIVETYGPGTSFEMMSVYHLDGDQLRATHYCAAGNQPRLLLDQEASSPEALVFAFDGGTNFDPTTDMHMHEGRILLHDADSITGEWTGYMDGKPAGTHSFVLSRVKD